MGVSIVVGVPKIVQNWMVNGKSYIKMMIRGGTPILDNLQRIEIVDSSAALVAV